MANSEVTPSDRETTAATAWRHGLALAGDILAEYEEAGGQTWPSMRGHIAERLAAFPVKYAMFALTSGQDEHLDAVKAQLGVDV